LYKNFNGNYTEIKIRREADFGVTLNNVPGYAMFAGVIICREAAKHQRIWAE